MDVESSAITPDATPQTSPDRRLSVVPQTAEDLGAAPASAAAVPTASAAPTAPAKADIGVKDRVVLVGLQSLSNCKGEVVDVTEDGKYMVKLDGTPGDHPPIGIYAANVQLEDDWLPPPLTPQLCKEVSMEGKKLLKDGMGSIWHDI